MESKSPEARYRAILAAELRAERDLERARAAAYIYLHERDAGDGSAAHAAHLHAEAETTPSVARGRTKLMEARLARQVAERVLFEGQR